MSNSHKAINHLLEPVVEVGAREQGVALHRGARRATSRARDDYDGPTASRTCTTTTTCGAATHNSSPAPPGCSPTRRPTSSSTCCSSTRPGRSSLANLVAAGTCGAQHRAARRPDAARAAGAGRAPGPLGRLGARLAARRRGDDRAGSRHLPGHHVAHAPCGVPLHLRRGVRRPPAARAAQRAAHAGAWQRVRIRCCARRASCTRRFEHAGLLAAQRRGGRAGARDLRQRAASSATPTTRASSTR